MNDAPAEVTAAGPPPAHNLTEEEIAGRRNSARLWEEQKRANAAYEAKLKELEGQSPLKELLAAAQAADDAWHDDPYTLALDGDDNVICIAGTDIPALWSDIVSDEDEPVDDDAEGDTSAKAPAELPY